MLAARNGNRLLRITGDQLKTDYDLGHRLATELRTATAVNRAMKEAITHAPDQSIIGGGFQLQPSQKRNSSNRNAVNV